MQSWGDSMGPTYEASVAKIEVGCCWLRARFPPSSYISGNTLFIDGLGKNRKKIGTGDSELITLSDQASNWPRLFIVFDCLRNHRCIIYGFPKENGAHMPEICKENRLDLLRHIIPLKESNSFF